MRKSNLILWSTIGLFFAAFFTVMIIARAGISKNLQEQNISAGGSGNSAVSESVIEESGTVTYPYTNFSQLAFDGNWNVTIEYGTWYYCHVEYPGDRPDDVKINQKEALLTMKNSGESEALDVLIVLPEMDKLDLSGNATARFRALSGDHLTLNLQGNSSVTGEMGIIQNMELSTKGESRADFTNMKTVNAEVDMKDQSRVQVMIDNGSLSGRLSDSAVLEYSGRTASRDLKAMGQAQILQP